jgi:hypothetical protein
MSAFPEEAPPPGHRRQGNRIRNVSNLAEMLVSATKSIQERHRVKEETAYLKSRHGEDPRDFDEIALDVG